MIVETFQLSFLVFVGPFRLEISSNLNKFLYSEVNQLMQLLFFKQFL
jgi:hypothetical protein